MQLLAWWQHAAQLSPRERVQGQVRQQRPRLRCEVRSLRSEVRGLRSEVCGLCVSSFSAALASPPDAAALILNWSCSLSDCAAFADARVLALAEGVGLVPICPSSDHAIADLCSSN
mmetsp:Transcript_17766/g.44154  ORF Transcript_17766/g.44154 Transcript_17766/m.44154 type:complete len:116 (-) Transcript_17766:656-1003(-)